MAAIASFGSFSIREYASKMRSIDVEKSWPFGGGEKELKRDEIEGLLPPIVCRKYRWWSDEVVGLVSEETEVLEEPRLEFAKADEEHVETGGLEEISSLGLEKLRIEEVGGEEEADLGMRKEVLGFDEERTVKICPVCRIFTASTVNAVNAHIDSCLAQASRAERRQMREKKAKSRMPKKRSIVELFAVAPQIETVEEDDRGEDDADAGEGDGGCDMEVVKGDFDAGSKTMRRKKKLKELMEKMKKKKKNQKRKKKKKKKKMVMSKKKHSNGILSLFTRLGSKKEKIHKLKIPSEVDYAQILQCSLHNKRLVKDIMDPIGIQKEKHSNVKSSLKKNHLKNFQASKSIAKVRVESPVFPVHSILKNQSRASSLQKSPIVGNLQGVNLTEQTQVRHSDRHVRFSGKDEFLGHPKTCHSSIDLPQMENLCQVFSDIMAAPSEEDQLVEVDKHVPAMDEAKEVTESDKDASVNVIDGSEVQSIRHTRCLADTHGHDAPCPVIVSRNRVSHDMGNISLDKSVDLNWPLLQYDSLHLYNPNSSNASDNISCIPKSVSSIPKERGVGFQAEGDVQRTSTMSRSLRDPFADPIASSSAVHSLENITRNVASQPSLCCSVLNVEMNEKQLYPSPGDRPNSNGCTLQYRQLCSLPPKDPITGTFFSTVDRNKPFSCKSGHFGASRSITDPIFLCSDKYADEDFVGLPLNSQGELIKLHPTGKVGLNQAFKKQNTTMGSVGSFPIYNVVAPKSIMDHSNKDKLQSAMAIPSLKWFPEQNYFKNPTNAPASSSLGPSAWNDIGRTKVQFHDRVMEKEQSSHRLDSELHMNNISCCGRSAYYQCHNHVEKEKYQSMENSDREFRPIAQPTLRLMGKNVMVGRSDSDGQGFEDGKVWTDKEVIAEQHPPITVSDNFVPRGFPQEWIACPVSGISEKLNHSVEAQSSPNSPSILQMTAVEPMPSSRYYNCQTHLMSLHGLPIINGNHGSELPPFTHTLLDKTSKFPKNCFSGTEFIRMSHQRPIHASSSQNDCLQQMLLNSTQSQHNPGLIFRAPSDFDLSFSNHDGGGRGQPSCMQCSSPTLPLLLNAAQQRKTLFSYSSQPPDSFPNHHPCIMSRTNLLPLPSPYFTSMISFPSHISSASDPCLQNPSTPASLPSFIPSFPGFKPMPVIKTSFKNRNKVMDSAKSKSTCSKAHGHCHSKKAKKRPAEKSDSSTKPMKKPNLQMQDSNAVMGSKEREELHGYGEQMVDVNLSRQEIVKDGLGTASRDNAFKLGGSARSRPIKLSAGAKHILKPSQSMDQDNSRPTHSTIPCAVVTDTSKVPDFQKKMAKIYRF